ncbi:MAG: hydantoinase/oxoprolinase family protein [Deltaproteobacteria bacterium]|nr:hydantoinase/oxoprolinase family protein [Deltaproteobacteria bacterium]
MLVIGIDTGGTFTDFVYREGSRWGVQKLPSTPLDPSRAVLEGIRKIAGERKKRIIHGSTVATNAILERKGALTALVTNKGFEDVLEIGRQVRERLYDLDQRRPKPLVPSSLRFGIRGRILHTGEVAEPLDEDELRRLAGELRDEGVEAVAVCLLFSFANPSHENRVGELLGRVGLQVSLSHEILAEFREFERTSTTVLNAYVVPKIRRYVGRLRASLGETDTLSIMQSNGGRISADVAMKESVRTILSGPAGGAVGAFELGRMAGYENLITFDMGGTSTDVSLVDGQLSLTLESRISGLPVRTPMIDIHTVGAGGGSIASLDAGGALKVGPESAGADPGPICYGRGERITVTDANLFLGRLIPEHFLGGGMKLNHERLFPYFEKMARRASLSQRELAEGILWVVNSEMEKAVRVISVERGYDPRDFTLFSFGGAGGMHAAFLARLLRIPRVLIPPNPGILSALGMIMADVIKDYSLTIMMTQAEARTTDLEQAFSGLERRGVEDLLNEGVLKERLVLERYLDMRYEGQSYEILVPFDGGDPVDLFHSLHEKTYGYKNTNRPVEFVNIRLRARGIPEKPRFERSEPKVKKPPAGALLGVRKVVFDHKALETNVYDREKLLSGNLIEGPAMVVEYSSTIVIPPFARAAVDGYGNMVIEVT